MADKNNTNGTEEKKVVVNTENPFAYSHGTEETYSSFATQRGATYFKATPNAYHSTEHDAFYYNVEVGTPNIAYINGIPEEKDDTGSTTPPVNTDYTVKFDVGTNSTYPFDKLGSNVTPKVGQTIVDSKGQRYSIEKVDEAKKTFTVGKVLS